MRNFVEELEIIENKFDNNMRELAIYFLKEVLAPFCKKHKFSFISGMGVYGFRKNNKFIDGFYFRKNNTLKEYKILCNILDDQKLGQTFFWYMEDFKYNN